MRRTQKQVAAQVAKWNRETEVGRLVKYFPVLGRPEYETAVTNSEAYALSGHTAVVGLVGKSGCFALDNIEPYPKPPDISRIFRP
jgi:hypothetical protein